MFFRKNVKVQSESDEQLRFWNANGYLVLPQAIDAAACDAISREVERHTGGERHSIGSRLSIDVLHGPHAGRLMRAADAPDEVFDGPFKLNNLFIDSDPVRRGMYHPGRRMRRRSPCTTAYLLHANRI